MKRLPLEPELLAPLPAEIDLRGHRREELGLQGKVLHSVILSRMTSPCQHGVGSVKDGRLLAHTDQWTNRRPSEERLAL